MKFCVYTLGCKTNQYESNILINALREKGYFVTETLEVCDRYIINTCAVTAEAEKKSRKTVSKINGLNPKAYIYVIGCASQNNANAFFNKTNVKFISGTANKNEIINKLETEGVCISELPKNYEDSFINSNVKTRAFIKIQDGCNNFCSYCIIPYLRGRSRSRSKESIKQEILSLNGDVKEFVLTGINISDYGKDINSSLYELIDYLGNIKARLRIGSLEAGIIEKELLESLKKSENFCAHFHLSLQSGSESVLKSMNRHYTPSQFLDSIKLIREYFCDVAITTDIICGFPTETEEDFLQTVEFCKIADFSDIHIFNYSVRPGTKAQSLKPLDSIIVKQRATVLNDLKLKLKNSFIEKGFGKKYTMLTEATQDNCFSGYTENYIKLYIKGDFTENNFYDVVPYGLYMDGAIAEKA